ncbi:MAG TPA: hypothetical protein VJT72_05375, partial [Pseudonocardiaceae bacterium]|nr:hypothetical protein [Pseudonocardiaceae bacterium]
RVSRAPASATDAGRLRRLESGSGVHLRTAGLPTLLPLTARQVDDPRVGNGLGEPVAEQCFGSVESRPMLTAQHAACGLRRGQRGEGVALEDVSMFEVFTPIPDFPTNEVRTPWSTR